MCVCMCICNMLQQQSMKCVSHLFSDILARVVFIKCHQSELEMFVFSSFSYCDLELFFLPLSLTFFVFVNSKKVSKSLKIYILRPKLEMDEKKSPINFWLLCSFYVPDAGTKRFPFYLDERANNCRDMQTDLKRCSFIPFYLCITNQAWTVHVKGISLQFRSEKFTMSSHFHLGMTKSANLYDWAWNKHAISAGFDRLEKVKRSWRRDTKH